MVGAQLGTQQRPCFCARGDEQKRTKAAVHGEGGMDLDLLSQALLARWRRNEGWPGCWLLAGGLLLSR
jgi:hypothetical protein